MTSSCRYVVYKYQTPKAFGSAKYCTSGDQIWQNHEWRSHEWCQIWATSAVFQLPNMPLVFCICNTICRWNFKRQLLKQEIGKFGHFLASTNFSVKLQFSNNILKKSFKEKTPKKPFFKILIFVYRAVVENTARLMRLPCSSGKYSTVNYIIKFRLPYSISQCTSLFSFYVISGN